jgi:hypothetical protein
MLYTPKQIAGMVLGVGLAGIAGISLLEGINPSHATAELTCEAPYTQKALDDLLIEMLSKQIAQQEPSLSREEVAKRMTVSSESITMTNKTADVTFCSASSIIQITANGKSMAFHGPVEFRIMKQNGSPYVSVLTNWYSWQVVSLGK